MTLSSPLPAPVAMSGPRAPATAWRAALPVLALAVAAILALYRETAGDMVATWLRSATFTHAFLVPPISLWLLWRMRDRLTAIAPRADARVLPAMAVAAFAWLAGALAAVNVVAQLAFVAMLVLAVPAVLGPRVARAAAFPLAFLFFAVPLGEFLLPWLMQRTADFTVAALRLSGVPVFREGLLFVLPSGNWSVIEACSGIRYLIASLMVGTLYAWLTYRSTRRRVLFMAVAIALPLLANWLRAYLIVMLGHLSDNRIATGVDHLIYGGIFFGVVILLLYLIGARWAEPPAPSGLASWRLPASPDATPAHGSAWTTLAVAGALVLLAAAPLSARREILRRETAAAPVLVAPPVLAGGCVASGRPAADWRPRLDNPSAEVDATYVCDDQPPVGLHLAYYRNQDARRKLGDADALLAPGEDRRWRRVAEGRREVALAPDAAGTRVVDVRTAELRDDAGMNGGDGPTVSAWQLYWVGGRFTASDTVAKALVALDRLRGRGDDSAEIVVAVTGAATPGAADRALEAFLRADLGAIDAQLARVRNQR